MSIGIDLSSPERNSKSRRADPEARAHAGRQEARGLWPRDRGHVLREARRGRLRRVGRGRERTALCGG